jgi:hypothetical protein
MFNDGKEKKDDGKRERTTQLTTLYLNWNASEKVG